MGLEPTRHECHKILSLARLPVPTLPHIFIHIRKAVFLFCACDRNYYSIPGQIRQQEF